MIQSVRKWNEIHALVMLFAAGVALGLGLILPLLIFASISFGVLICTCFKRIAQLKPAGGVANWVTMVRLLLLIYVCYNLHGMHPMIFTGLALLVIIADGFDGYLARRLNQETEFGAAFDMEVDAFFGVAMSVLIYQQFEIGEWLVVAGVMRYVFVFILMVLGWNNRPKVHMPESKTIAVLFFLSLLTPFILPMEWAFWLLLTGSLLIYYSFGKELVLLARESGE